MNWILNVNVLKTILTKSQRGAQVACHAGMLGCNGGIPVPGKVWSCTESHNSHLSDGGDGDSDWMWCSENAKN